MKQLKEGKEEQKEGRKLRNRNRNIREGTRGKEEKKIKETFVQMYGTSRRTEENKTTTGMFGVKRSNFDADSINKEQ
jgi:hypothetical protein